MKTQLEALLDTLQTELRGASGMDTEARARIQSQVDEIQEFLDRSTSGAESASYTNESSRVAEPAGLGERLRDSTLQFEEEHPRLTAAVEQVIDLLGKMGI